MSSSRRTLPIRPGAIPASLLALATIATLTLAGADVGVRTLMAAGLSKNAAGTGITLVAVVVGLTALLRLRRAATTG
ncbi:hypothetical protein [Natronoarchaeum rubrum]|uniref:hypothetical protein n=1 Tax=Natronoarchaeum rubrum TaxID=755311 RepID=UPI002113206A|nr:hypothetical protein [Natronoarchaeum rubrum]